MKLPRTYTLGEISKILSSDHVGIESIEITGINEIHFVEVGDIAFVDHPKYYDKTLASKASVIIIDKTVDCPEGKGLIIHPEPFKAFNQLTSFFKPFEIAHSMINITSSVGEGCTIQPGVFLGNNVRIGKNTILHPGVVVYDNVTIGDNVIIHSNSVIGGDAFYYKRSSSGHQKFLSVGRVIIENDVEIGASCTIDRGSTADTVIGEGTKLDNQVHLAHDTRIGKRCIIAAQTGISGCVTIEDDVVIWGQVGLTANITIGKGATILAQSGVVKSVASNETVFGSPAKDARIKMREISALTQLTASKLK